MNLRVVSRLMFLVFVLHQSDNVNKSQQILECISAICSKSKANETLLVLSSWPEVNMLGKLANAKMMINFKFSLKSLSPFGVFNMFVLIFDVVEQFSAWLQRIVKLKCWNPRGKFIIAFFQPVNTTEVFRIAWYYFIMNINLIVMRNTKLEVYTYYPLKNIEPVFHFSCNDKFPKELFPNKIPKILDGRVIRILAYKMFPYVLKTKSVSKERPEKAGIEVTLMRNLALRLNFTESYVQHNYNTWGLIYPNDTATNMFEGLLNREADVLIGMIPQNFELTRIFDVTTQHLLDDIAWWVPAAQPLPRWQNVVRLFSRTVWLIITLTLIVIAAAWKLTNTNLDIGQSFLQPLAALLQQTIRTATRHPVRILFICWTTSSLLLSTAFHTNLVSILTQPQFEKQISNLPEVLDSELTIGFHDPLLALFQDKNDILQVKVLKARVYCPLSEDCLNQTAFQRNMAVLKTTRSGVYLTKQYYLSPNGRPMVYKFKGPCSTIVVFAANKGFPFISHFNKYIRLMKSSGLVDKWDKELAYVKKHLEELNLAPLTLSNISVAYILLLTGISAACLAFICEILYYIKFIEPHANT